MNFPSAFSITSYVMMSTSLLFIVTSFISTANISLGSFTKKLPSTQPS